MKIPPELQKEIARRRAIDGEVFYQLNPDGTIHFIESKRVVSESNLSCKQLFRSEDSNPIST